MAENDDNTTDSFYGGVTSGQEKVSVEDYQSGYFNPFYQTLDTSGIQVATIDEDEDDEDTTATSNILDPVGDDSTVLDVFRTTSDPSQMGLGTVFGTEDAATYINNYNASANKDKSGDLFSAENLEAAGGVPAAVATLATGLPISGLAVGMSALVKKEHRKNAAAIVASGNSTGDMFTFNGQTVSRAPGSKIFSGNLGGLSQGDMYRSREISKGFIPGTMNEAVTSVQIGAGPQGMPQATGLAGVARIDGAIMDAFGTIHTGQRDEGGHMMTSASQAQALREQEFRDAARRQGVDISGLGKMDFTMAAVDYKKSVDKNMRAQDYHGGFFHKTSNMTATQNNQALKDRINFGNTSIKDVANKYNLPGGSQPSQPSQTFVQTSMPQSEAAAKDSDRDDDRPSFVDTRRQETKDRTKITTETVKEAKNYKDQYDEDDFIDESGEFTKGFRDEDKDDDPGGGGGGCCFIMLEARYGDGTMDDVVRRYRDEHMTDRNKRGYYKVAEVLVPLMRKSRLAKWLVTKTFADPLVSYGKYYYGQNKHGIIFAPIKSFWMSVFNTVGGETQFIRESGEVV